MKYIPFRKYQIHTWRMIWNYWTFFCCVMILKEPNKYLLYFIFQLGVKYNPIWKVLLYTSRKMWKVEFWLVWNWNIWLQSLTVFLTLNNLPFSVKLPSNSEEKDGWEQESSINNKFIIYLTKYLFKN